MGLRRWISISAQVDSYAFPPCALTWPPSSHHAFNFIQVCIDGTASCIISNKCTRCCQRYLFYAGFDWRKQVATVNPWPRQPFIAALGLKSTELYFRKGEGQDLQSHQLVTLCVWQRHDRALVDMPTFTTWLSHHFSWRYIVVNSRK